jgi:hypothetical protein
MISYLLALRFIRRVPDITNKKPVIILIRYEKGKKPVEREKKYL